MEQTWIRLIVAIAFSVTSFGAFADDASVDRLLEGDPKMIIVGENHKASGLARGVTALLKSLRSKAEFNCVFLELPRDYQTQLSKAIEAREIEDVASVIVESKLEATMQAYEHLGSSVESVRSTRAALIANPLGAIDKFPIDSQLVSFAADEGVRILAMDADSNSSQTYQSILQNLKLAEQPGDQTSIESIRAFDERSAIMSKNVEELSREYDCDRSVLVVGYAHLFKSDFMKYYGRDETLHPLQNQLEEKGISSKVLITDDKDGDGIVFDSSMTDYFDGFYGRLPIGGPAG